MYYVTYVWSALHYRRAGSLSNSSSTSPFLQNVKDVPVIFPFYCSPTLFVSFSVSSSFPPVLSFFPPPTSLQWEIYSSCDSVKIVWVVTPHFNGFVKGGQNFMFCYRATGKQAARLRSSASESYPLISSACRSHASDSLEFTSASQS